MLPNKIVSFNPFALRRAKTPESFGQSECNRVKQLGFWFISFTISMLASKVKIDVETNRTVGDDETTALLDKLFREKYEEAMSIFMEDFMKRGTSLNCKTLNICSIKISSFDKIDILAKINFGGHNTISLESNENWM